MMVDIVRLNQIWTEKTPVEMTAEDILVLIDYIMYLETKLGGSLLRDLTDG
jgi:hypothetical protein